MTLLSLLLGFLRVGVFSFGGAYAAIPLIRDVVLSQGWLSDAELSYMIAVSESTPGPIMVNLATYIGSSQAGIWGSVLATAAVVLPSFIIILLVTAVLKKVIRNRYVQAVLRGLNPCIIGIVLATGLYMAVRGVCPDDGASFDLRALILTLLLAALTFAFRPLFKKALSPVKLILISAVCGIVLYGI